MLFIFQEYSEDNPQTWKNVDAKTTTTEEVYKVPVPYHTYRETNIFQRQGSGTGSDFAWVSITGFVKKGNSGFGGKDRMKKNYFPKLYLHSRF